MIPETLDFTSKKLDLVIEQETTIDFILTYMDAQSVPIDLTNYVAKMQIRERYGDKSVVLSLTSDETSGSRLIKNNIAGQIRIILDDQETNIIPQGDYHYDLVITAVGDVRRLLSGSMVIKPAVTDVP